MGEFHSLRRQSFSQPHACLPWVCPFSPAPPTSPTPSPLRLAGEGGGEERGEEAVCLQRLFGPATHRVREAQAFPTSKGVIPW